MFKPWDEMTAKEKQQVTVDYKEHYQKYLERVKDKKIEKDTTIYITLPDDIDPFFFLGGPENEI